MQLLRYAPIFWDLIKTDLQIMRPLVKDKLIDLFIWVSTMTCVTAYIMPAFGLSTDYGAFMLASLCSAVGLFEVFPGVMNFISDLENDRLISYYLTLPLPTPLVFLRAMINYALTAAVLGILILPLGKLLLWNILDVSKISFVKYSIIFVFANCFYGTLTLVTASYVKNMLRVGSVWMRFIYPIHFLGCFQFSWQALYGWSPTLAYINLLNPITYIAEGYRAAILGQEGYLNFWLCIGVLSFFIVGTGLHSIVRLKKRLDFI